MVGVVEQAAVASAWDDARRGRRPGPGHRMEGAILDRRSGPCRVDARNYRAVRAGAAGESLRGACQGVRWAGIHLVRLTRWLHPPGRAGALPAFDEAGRLSPRIHYANRPAWDWSSVPGERHFELRRREDHV